MGFSFLVGLSVPHGATDMQISREDEREPTRGTSEENSEVESCTAALYSLDLEL